MTDQAIQEVLCKTNVQQEVTSNHQVFNTDSAPRKSWYPIKNKRKY